MSDDRPTIAPPGLSVSAADVLDARKATILRAVVEQHISTGQPVGSGLLAATGLGVSAATVRNEMSVLEREGFLTHPHTSAGRIPTDKGYRFFVDSMTRPAALSEPSVVRVSEFFNQAHGEIERLLTETSRLLSDVTDYAAVVIAPAHEVATIRSVQIVSLGTHVRDGRVSLNALLVVVLSDGSVGKHTLELDDSTSDEVLREAATRLAGVLVGRPLGQVEPSSPGRQEPDDRRSDDPISALVRVATRALRPERASLADEGEVFVEGRARMATVFDTVETIRSVLAVLEKHYVVVSLLREALDRGGPQDGDQQVRVGTSIGAEHGSDVVFEPLHACSVIVAPYLVDGRPAGSVGVLGPTRMNYPQAMAAVAEVSARLSQRLSDG